MRQLRIASLVLSFIIVAISIHQYFLCPRYDFMEPVPFSGLRITNPYDSTSVGNWVKCNFHAHANCWGGITNGHGNAEDVHRAYEKLNYGIHCVSNYHNIDTTRSRKVGYIAAYEHGYNIQKTHQLVLGSKKVVWTDYIFPQTKHNKQYILNQLRDQNGLIILNHPALRKGYTKDDLGQIVGYDCMEVLNPSVTSLTEWDAALSAGRRAFIVGDDDIHNVFSEPRLGTRCTFVNVKANSAKEVLTALKNGKSYGVIIGSNQHHDSIPYLKSVQVVRDSIYIQMSEEAETATLAGQGGKTLLEKKSTAKIRYRLLPQDHYARASFEFKNGTVIFLNPIFFSSGKNNLAPVEEDEIGTILYRAIGACIMLLWIMFAKWFTKRKPPKPGGLIAHRRPIPVQQD
ncbi:MAG: hypothetical protein BGO21_18170 [Dyadobacter sp. 50-39]|uniref:hypothetical protein n=1 Tax=Dyadobacter sp. 50-39 TaxID=1895756 RepID=UPI000961858D|nr:hypothetical protein [Dyadobacter sp. 50-39]OJV14632.1 MAG: hypothetical protein BGO21_18170 [Dyadobacter sp. 50-39]